MQLQLDPERAAKLLTLFRPRIMAAIAGSAIPRYLTHMVVALLVVLSSAVARPSIGRYADQASAPAPVQLPASPAGNSSDLETAIPSSQLGETAKSVPWQQRGLSLLDFKGEPTTAATPTAGQKAPAQPTKPKAPNRYKVAEGDTVSGIAEKFGISADTVMSANDLSDPNNLQIGDELDILPVSGVLHTVADGDNINDLALLYGVTAESIAEFNGLVDPNMLRLGDKLIVPDGKIQMARASSVSRGGRPSAAATGSFRWPTGGTITQYFGENGHSGLDIANQQGTVIGAADGGVVVTALKLGYGYGWHLVIDHGNGYRTLYSHLSAFHVDYGERVAKGESIGLMGSTGLSTGPHLHFEVFQNGVRVNPLKFLP